MGAPRWLRQAIEEYGPRASREGWGYKDWIAHTNLGTAYRAKEAARVLRSDVADRYSPPVWDPDEVARRLDAWESPRQRRAGKRAAEISETDGDDGKRGHWYETVEATGDYRFWLRGRARPVVLSRDDVRELVASYVSDGDGVTQQALARQFGLTRRAISACLRALGVYKDSPPILPDDLEDMDEEEAADEWAASKAARIERKAHRKAWAEVERDARRWRDLERSALQYVSGAVRSVVESCALDPLAGLPADDGGGDRALLIIPTDVHIGKRGWEGFGPNSTTTEETQRRLWSAARRVFDLAPGGPDRVEVIYLTIGGDLFHVDTGAATTTRGTPQDMDVTPEEMIATAIPLLFQLVRALAMVAPVRLILHGGNHDSMLALAAYVALCEAFRDSNRVEQAGDPDHPWGPYQAVRYGASLLGFTHGDGRYKVADLAPLMAQRWPKMWAATRHRYWFTGHRHHHAVEEARGVEVHTTPSISGADRYHSRHWPHEARPRLAAHVLDHDRGMVATLWGDID